MNFICFAIVLLSVTGAKEFGEQIFAGYQGWFNTPKHAPLGWVHWSRGNSPSKGKVTFEIFPDLREYPEEVLEKTSLGNLGNGSPAKLYHADSDGVINLHLSWMKQYGIDGVALQRFVCELRDSRTRAWRTSVLERFVRLAPAHGRSFYVMYDISGTDSGLVVNLIKSDWEYLKSKFYIYLNGLNKIMGQHQHKGTVRSSEISFHNNEL